MPAKVCPQCGSTQLHTDYAAGTIVCEACGTLVEEGILVAEVGFAEGSGGRVHVQGSFVAHGSTGIAGFRGRGNAQTSENVKAQGQARIHRVAQEMDLGYAIEQGAIRTFSLAVDQRFNRGRKTDYLVASCLYLQCRLMKDVHMLIDFAERLRVNVYELAQTYLKLRTSLHLDKTMPEVDPAIYNIHFAKRLEFGESASTVAADASRLVRRFKADWMTQGRRPAGICGACLIIAGRMSNFLRSVDEVAQVVKCSPHTIRHRLTEFVNSSMAQRTVAEWRLLKDEELDEGEEEVPPIVKYQRRKAAEKAERESQAREGSQITDPEGGRDGDPSHGAEELAQVLQGLREEVDAGENEAELNPDEEEEDLAPMDREAYVHELATAGDNPEEASAELRKRKSRFQREARAMTNATKAVGADENPAAVVDQLELVAAHSDDEDDAEDDADGDEEGARRKRRKAEPPFTEWDDSDAVLTHFTERYFGDERVLFNLNEEQLKNRVKQWLKRDAKEMLGEMMAVEDAYRRRKRLAMVREEEFADLDDRALEADYLLEPDETEARARIWLRENGKWLEESKKRAEEKALYNKSRGIDPNKPKPKRKRGGAQAAPKQQFESAAESIKHLATQKNFSNRINYAALRALGINTGGDDNLQAMEDDEKFEDDDEKEEEDYNNAVERLVDFDAASEGSYTW